MKSVLFDLTRISWFSKWLMVGFICQSVLIGGGYATGREIIEFFMMNGVQQGFYGMLLSTLFFGIIGAVTFEYARKFQLYDYRSFFKHLLPGPTWLAFEFGYIALLILIGAILTAASGSILEQWLNVPYLLGVGIFLVGVVFMLLGGSNVISTLLSYWSFLLYAVMVTFLIAAYQTFGTQGVSAAWNSTAGTNSIMDVVMGAFKYSLYNIATFIVALYSLREPIKTSKEAYLNGFIAAIIMMIPAIIIYFAMVPIYPAVLENPIPVFSILKDTINSKTLTVVYIIMLFGTSLETLVGFIHTLNERINSVMVEKGKELTPTMRAAIGIALLAACYVLSKIGVVGLIGQGYSMAAWYFLAIMVLPLLTIGIIRINKK